MSIGQALARFFQIWRSVGWIHLLFSFRGRINRRRYWLIVPVLIVPVVGWNAFFLLVESASADDDLIEWVVLLVAMTLLLSIYVAVAITVKRLHDRNRRAWWVLLCFAPLALMMAGSTMIRMNLFGPAIPPANLLGYLYLLVLLWCVVDLGILPGTHGPNRFGDAPLDKAATVATFE